MKKEKLQWHPGFCAAIQIELEDQAGEMDFLSEYNLSKKPLQADLVIIKKQSDIPSGNENNLCGILSRYNILEYKSPSDTMTIDDYYKVNAYACLFKTDSRYSDRIKAMDITIILVCSKRPLKLLKYLKNCCKMVITTISPGIYEAAGSGLFRTYMIVAHPRYGGSYPWPNALTDSFTDHDRTHVKQLLKEVDESPDANREAVLELLMKANPELIQKIKKEEDMRSLQILFAPELAEAKAKLRIQVEQEVRDEFDQKVRAQVEQDIRSEVEQKVRAQVEQKVRSEVEQKVRAQVKQEVRSEVEQKVRAQVKQEVRSEVEQKVRAQAQKEARTATEAHIRRTACNMFQHGFSPDDTAGIMELDMKIVKKWHREWKKERTAVTV